MTTPIRRLSVRCAIAALLGFAATPVLAQTGAGVVRGRVSTDSGRALAGARVAISGSSRTASTDPDGAFIMANVAVGAHTITARAAGFAPWSGSLTVTAGDTVTLTIRLAARPATLDVVTIEARGRAPASASLPPEYGTLLLGGKKNQVVSVAASAADLAENNPRQVFARVPGISVWELDGNGLQVNVAARGLNPHRSWEFLVQENGRHVNSDLYGYPEAHYNPPMEAVDRIEVIHGSEALAFGPQYGGAINYVLKRGVEDRPVALEARVSSGSDGLAGGYAAVGGQAGRVNHYSYVNYRRRDGWRDHSGYDFFAAHSGVDVAVTPTLHLGAESSWMYYVVQFAGGLDDAQFAADARQTTRARNYFSPHMALPSAWLRWTPDTNTVVDVRASGLVGQRNSVQFIANPAVVDTLGPRQVDRDYYAGAWIDGSVRRTYSAWSLPQSISAGIKLFDERTTRRQRGAGTTGSDYDLQVSAPYPTDLLYFTRSAAAYLEHALTPARRLTLTAGVRDELTRTHFHGAIGSTNYNDDGTRRTRHVPLLGASARYQIADATGLYAGWSQTFRPVLYSDLIPSGTIARVDSSLRDSRGSNGEVGVRGTWGRSVQYDVALFQLRYPNRTGTVVVGAGTPGAYILRTNVGASVATGVESYVEVHPLAAGGAGATDLAVFNATAYDHARYASGTVAVGSGSSAQDESLAGKHVEGAPEWTVRSGVTLQRERWSVTMQHSYVSRSFGDALNSPVSATGVVGPVPAYTILDVSAGLRFRGMDLSAGVNNLADERYFTRRTGQYPGPGLIPSDGRTLFVSLGRRP